MQMMNMATRASMAGRFLRSCDSSSTKGSMKCPTTSAMATQPHEPVVRCTYQGISSGRLPDQMIRNCEKFRYAHSIVKASSSLPRSWKCRGLMMSAPAPERCSSARTMIVSANAVSPQPAIVKQAEDGREPLRVERHDPVDRGEGHRQHQEEEARRADRPEPHAVGWRRRQAAVLFRRPAVEQHDQQHPEREVEDRADEEEPRIEVAGLGLDDGVVGRLRPRPLEEDRQLEGDRDEEERDDRQRPGRGFEDAAADEPPLAARHVLQHQQRRASPASCRGRRESRSATNG